MVKELKSHFKESIAWASTRGLISGVSYSKLKFSIRGGVVLVTIKLALGQTGE